MDKFLVEIEKMFLGCMLIEPMFMQEYPLSENFCFLDMINNSIYSFMETRSRRGSVLGVKDLIAWVVDDLKECESEESILKHINLIIGYGGLGRAVMKECYHILKHMHYVVDHGIVCNNFDAACGKEKINNLREKWMAIEMECR